MYIFGMVRKDVNLFLKKKKGKISKVRWKPSVYWNPSLRDEKRKVMGIDVDGAYWKIAYEMGVISKQTFDHGLLIKEKNIRLAALANLGSDKIYTRIKDGKLTDEIVVVRGNDTLKQLYKSIRYKCFRYMEQLASMLGDDFVCYKTDCIYFYSSAHNSQIVRKFLEKHRFDYKVLKDFSTPEEPEEIDFSL